MLGLSAHDSLQCDVHAALSRSTRQWTDDTVYRRLAAPTNWKARLLLLSTLRFLLVFHSKFRWDGRALNADLFFVAHVIAGLASPRQTARSDRLRDTGAHGTLM